MDCRWEPRLDNLSACMESFVDVVLMKVNSLFGLYNFVKCLKNVKYLEIKESLGP